MNSSAKKNKGPSMISALSPNGLAGIAPGIGIQNENFNGCFSVHQVISPIIYFDIKKEWHFPSKNSSSNTDVVNPFVPCIPVISGNTCL